MKVYNTMTKQKEEFIPIHGNRVNMFVCGPTVYDYSHIGHARTYVAYDIIVRWLRKRGYSVFYIMNITDVDDKIINRARERGIKPLELAREYENAFYEDMKTMGVYDNINLFPRASEHIPEIIEQVKVLIEKGYAYVTEDGNVYYDITKFPDYGKLSKKKPEELLEHRIEPDPKKRNPADFSLWKIKEEEIGWESPWGVGRPGWHIEDTAITVTYFGPQYDLHGGAVELTFPHHEAEIAQAEAYTGKKPLVKYWVHTGILLVDGKKMSKSLGNFITIRDMLKRYSPEVLRMYFAMTHYRSPINYSEDSVNSVKEALDSIYETIAKLKFKKEGENGKEFLEKIDNYRKDFEDAMDDDFNTPLAISKFMEFLRELNKILDKNGGISIEVKEKSIEFINYVGSVIGFIPRKIDYEKIIGNLVEHLLEERRKAREKKDYETADKIRAMLKEFGIIIEDVGKESYWRFE